MSTNFHNFIRTFLTLNFLVGKNPFKGIHLMSFGVFLPNFMIIERWAFLEAHSHFFLQGAPIQAHIIIYVLGVQKSSEL